MSILLVDLLEVDLLEVDLLEVEFLVDSLGRILGRILGNTFFYREMRGLFQ